MLKRASLIAVAAALGLAAPAMVNAAETPAKVEASKDVQAELNKLKKAVGAGEISAKEYQVRKAALLAGSQQTAKSEGK